MIDVHIDESCVGAGLNFHLAARKSISTAKRRKWRYVCAWVVLSVWLAEKLVVNCERL